MLCDIAPHVQLRTPRSEGDGFARAAPAARGVDLCDTLQVRVEHEKEKNPITKTIERYAKERHMVQRR